MVCKFADGTYYYLLCYMVALWQNDDFTYTYLLSILSIITVQFDTLTDTIR